MRVSQPPQPFLASAREWHPPHLHPPRRSLKRKNARRKHAHVSLRDCGRRHLAPRLEHRASGAHLKMWRAPRALRGGAVAPLAVAPLRQRIAIFALGSGRGAKQIPRAPGQHSRVVEEGGSGGARCALCAAPASHPSRWRSWPTGTCATSATDCDFRAGGGARRQADSSRASVARHTQRWWRW